MHIGKCGFWGTYMQHIKHLPVPVWCPRIRRKQVRRKVPARKPLALCITSSRGISVVPESSRVLFLLAVLYVHFHLLTGCVPLGGCVLTARTCPCQDCNNTNDLLLLGRRRCHHRHTYSTLGQQLRPFVLKKAHHRNDGRWCRCSFLTFGTSMLQLVDLHLDCEEVCRLKPGCCTTRSPGHLRTRSGKKKAMHWQCTCW